LELAAGEDDSVGPAHLLPAAAPHEPTRINSRHLPLPRDLGLTSRPGLPLPNTLDQPPPTTTLPGPRPHKPTRATSAKPTRINPRRVLLSRDRGLTSRPGPEPSHGATLQPDHLGPTHPSATTRTHRASHPGVTHAVTRPLGPPPSALTRMGPSPRGPSQQASRDPDRQRRAGQTRTQQASATRTTHAVTRPLGPPPSALTRMGPSPEAQSSKQAATRTANAGRPRLGLSKLPPPGQPMPSPGRWGHPPVPSQGWGPPPGPRPASNPRLGSPTSGSRDPDLAKLPLPG
jgi:hypothetical protein